MFARGCIIVTDNVMFHLCSTQPDILTNTLHKMRRILFILVAIATTLTLTAQELSYGQYMEQVLTKNIALTAQRLNIDIATAQVEASKVRNNPTLGITYSSNEDWSKKLGSAIEGELSRTFTFGVRKGGIELAQSKQKETAALLEEYIRNFRADATIAYLDHLKATMLLSVEEKREKELSAVALNDSIRFTKGDIAKADWLESRMAAKLAHNNRLQAEAGVTTTAIKLGYYMGDLRNAYAIRATGTLELNETAGTVDQYTEVALRNRADLQAALYRIDVAEATKRLNAAQRRTDLNVKLGATYNRGAHAEEPHSPSFTTVKAGVAIPLKFSNLNKGARTADRLVVQQARQEAEEARLAVQTEVMQAHNDYRYAIMQAETFTSGLLDEMEQVVTSKKRAYEEGDIPFLDYISAESRNSEMMHEYINALYYKAIKWVELQRATGCGMELSAQPINE